MKNKITFKNDEITVDMPNAVKNLNVKIVYIFPNPYQLVVKDVTCLLYTSPSPRDRQKSRMPSSA